MTFVKPKVCGTALNVAAVIVDPKSLVYCVNDGSVDAISSVRDNGVALRATVDYPDRRSLASAECEAGHYATCKAEGLIRLMMPPYGEVTADVVGPALTQADRIEALLSQILQTLRATSVARARAA
jgi:hypothetical protein